MIEINDKQELNELINQETPVLLDFYADWCGPCQSLLPIVESLADKHKDEFKVAKVNIDRNGDLARDYNVRSIPSLFFIKDQEVKENLLGLQTMANLDKTMLKYSN